MPTTTNNGWTTPADTALVKDGASAIRTLGNNIDSTLGVYQSPGLVKINTTTFSAVSSQSINDVFSANYDSYRVVTNLIGSTTAVGVDFRLRVGGADNSATNYRRQRLNASSTTISGSRLTAQTSWLNGGGIVSNASHTLNILELVNPFNSLNPSGFVMTNMDITGNIEHDFNSFGLDVTTSYTGFTIIPTSGTITGTVSVYGYNK